MKMHTTAKPIIPSSQTREKLIVLKPEFEKIRAKSYSQALEFWERNIIFDTSIQQERISLGTTFDLRSSKGASDKKTTLSISPNENDEIEKFNRWFFKHYSNEFYNLEKAKKEIVDTLEESFNQPKYLLLKIDSVKASSYRRLDEISPEEEELESMGYAMPEDDYEPTDFELKDHPDDDEFKSILFNYEVKGIQPDWSSAEEHTIKLFAAASFKIHLIQFLEEQLQIVSSGKTISAPNKIEKEISGIKNWNLRMRYYLAEQLGLLDNPKFRGDRIGQGAKHKLVANLLRCSPDNIKKIVNKKDAITVQEKKEVELYLNELK